MKVILLAYVCLKTRKAKQELERASGHHLGNSIHMSISSAWFVVSVAWSFISRGRQMMTTLFSCIWSSQLSVASFSYIVMLIMWTMCLPSDKTTSTVWGSLWFFICIESMCDLTEFWGNGFYLAGAIEFLLIAGLSFESEVRGIREKGIHLKQE